MRFATAPRSKVKDSGRKTQNFVPYPAKNIRDNLRKRYFWQAPKIPGAPPTLGQGSLFRPFCIPIGMSQIWHPHVHGQETGVPS